MLGGLVSGEFEKREDALLVGVEVRYLTSQVLLPQGNGVLRARAA